MRDTIRFSKLFERPRKQRCVWGCVERNVTILVWHPERGTERGHDIQVMGQKLAVLAAVIILSYQSWEAEQVAMRSEV